MTYIDKKLKLSRPVYLLLLHIRSFMNGLGQLSRAPFASIAIFIVVGISLALPMGLFVTLDNLGALAGGFKNTGQISLYLKKDISKFQLQQLERVIDSNRSISGYHYISPDQGMREFLKSSGLTNVASKLDRNPLPGVISIEPSVSMDDTIAIRKLYASLKVLPGVAMAQMDLTWLKRLQAILAICHRFAGLLMFIFALAVVFVVGNTISLTTKTYQHEVRVIKLLGGTNRFIRLPFLYSGIIYGLVGAIIAWFIVDIALWALSSPISRLANLYSSAYHVLGMDNVHTFYLIVGGMMLGFIGAWFAVGRELKAVDK